MKTDLVDVNETRKNLRVEIPSDVVDAEIDRIARDYSRTRQDSRLPSRQGAGARDQAAVQGSDPPRRRARPHPARGGRCAAGAGRRGGGYAGHPRRERRGGTGPHLHRVVRHGARLRAGRLRDGLAHAAVAHGRRRRRRPGAAAAARTRRALRAGRGPRRDRRRHGDARPRTSRRRPATPTTHTDVAVELGAKANPPGFDEQLLGLEVGRHEELHDALPGRLRD